MSKPPGPVARRGDYDFRAVPHRAGVTLIERFHYARGAANTSVLMMGCVRRRDGRLVGVAHVLPAIITAARFVARHAEGVKPSEVLSLSRLAIHPDEPTNAASMLIGATLRELARRPAWAAIVSYADEGEGHTGAIYRATNWTPLGRARPKTRWVDPRTGRMVARRATRDRTVAEMRALGYQRAGAHPKRRFGYALRPGVVLRPADC